MFYRIIQKQNGPYKSTEPSNEFGILGGYVLSYSLQRVLSRYLHHSKFGQLPSSRFSAYGLFDVCHTAHQKDTA